MPSSPASQRRILDWLGKITEPLEPSLEVDQKRRHRLLLGTNLVFLVGSLGYALLAPTAGPLSRQTLIGLSLVFLLSLPAFILGKRGKLEHYRPAVTLTLLATLSGGYTAAIFTSGSYLTIAHFGIPLIGVLLAGVFLNFRGVAIVAVLNLVLYQLLLALRIPLNEFLIGSSEDIALISPYSYIISGLQMFTLSGVFLIFIRFRDQLDADRLTARQIAVEQQRVAEEQRQRAAEQERVAEEERRRAEEQQERAAEQQRLAEELRELEKIKSAFLASMSHELRTPLNAIINYSKFVVRGVMGPVNDRQSETINKVVDSGQHLLNLINDILDMSKIESGAMTLFVEDNLNMNAILTSALETAQPILGDKPVRIETDIQPDLPPMLGDRKRLTQVVLNILSNACKFTAEGTIHISAHAEDGEVRIAVRDTGHGIAPGDYAAVFESFKQTRSGLRQGTGTGLGMPISRSLAEAHGGRLWFESELGAGTTFYVTLPLRHPALLPMLEG
jgi:signal transduction histidine kinase